MTCTRAILAIALFSIEAMAALGCGAAEGTGPSNGLDGGPGTPTGIALTSANGQVLVDWNPVAGALGYAVHWELGAVVDPQSPIKVVGAPPCLFENLPGGEIIHVVVATVGPGGEGIPSSTKTLAVAPGGAEKFFPAWANAVPTAVLQHDYNPSLSSAQNGANLKGLLQSLTPGEELQIGAGTWTIDAFFDLSLKGTAAAPIWITAQAGAKPIITRSDANQNTINIGSNGGARYLALRGLEVRGGDIAVRIRVASHVWIDQCELHACANNALAANSDPTDHLYITRNEVHDTAGFGEGLYIGGNLGSAVAHDCVIAQNHVYDTGGTQGDGIELKQGSWGNVIAENFVHDTHYPCILVYGTAGKSVNVVERNLCVGSGDAVLQVQGEAIVRNNVLANGATGFLSTDHQDLTRDLTFVHNTIVNTGTAAQMTSWNNRPGMTFANNAVYSKNGNAINFSSGSSGVLVTGNVAFGAVAGVAGGYALGSGLGDFAAATWDGAQLDVTPKPDGALDGAGSSAQMVVLELSGAMRFPKLEAGAVDSP